MTPYNPYYFNNYQNNPWIDNRFSNQMQNNMQGMNNSYQNQVYQPQPMNNQNNFILQGKNIENIDMVKVTDAPIDGSIAYFPMIDKSYIYTKQMQNDGTTVINAYKLQNTSEDKNESELNTKKISEELKSLKDMIGEIKTELKKQNKDKGGTK